MKDFRIKSEGQMVDASAQKGDEGRGLTAISNGEP
jgi:hypothetical protein